MSEPESEDHLHHHLLQNIKQSFTLADIEFSNHFPASVAQTNPPYLHYNNNNNNNNNSQALAQAQQLLQIGGGGGGHSPPAGAAAGLLSQGQGGPAAANLENFHFPPPPPPPPAAAAAAGLFINIPYHHHHHSTAAVTNSFITDEHEHAPPLILLNNNNNKHRKRITNNCGQAQKGERVGRGKKVKGNIIINEEEEEKGRDDVVHVRAKRGQATDTHSLAERVRRRKINERLRCLQDIVPGCYKTMGMAVMLDEIINYVQSLQTQVEFLSMRLTAASTFHDLNSSDTDNIGMETMLQKAKTFDQALNYYHHQNISLAAANQEQEGLPFAELLYNMPHHYHTSN